MWLSKRCFRTIMDKLEDLEKRTADLERQVQGQHITVELTYEFCKSVANKERLSLLSYQQLNSPSADSDQKIRMLLEQIRELRKSTFY